MTKIVTFAVRYSPNLGDGVISDCLENAIVFANPAAKVVHIDLAGRQDFGDVTVRSRGLILKILPMLPLALRQGIVQAVLGRKLTSYRDLWKNALDGADLAVIGGGQLFADADLNFPLKLSAVAQSCEELKVPTSIYGVGVAKGWSQKGRNLFGRLFSTDIRHIAVRDIGSKDALAAQMGTVPLPIEVIPDPAVIAHRCYGEPPKALSKAVEGRIGICVTAEEVLNYHADMNVAGAGGVSSLFTGLIGELASLGEDLALFTNGAVEDELALDRICQDPAVADLITVGRLYRHPKFSNPEELVHAISAHKTIVAHRLHAIIVAYAYKIPAVGLGWDQKVLSFFKEVRREKHCVVDSHISVPALVGHIMSVRDDAIDPVRHAEVAAAADAGIRNLLNTAAS